MSTGSGGATSGTTSTSSSATDGSTSTGFIATTATGAGGQNCTPPDMIIALDRTQTMHFEPDGTTPADSPNYPSSKFAQAITAIQALVKAPADQTIRFGLELWPKEEPGCVTVAQRIAGTQATNPQCEDGEVLFPPALGNGAQISGSLDPTTTKICISTPTGQGLQTAADQLDKMKEAGRAQFILLVTDGADWDQSCPTPDPVAVSQQLATQGIKTFVLGFSATGDVMPGGTGAPFLNNMACAGMTAPDFATNCKQGTNGYEAVDPMGKTLYLQASDEAGLSTALQSVAALVCCNCVQ